jgi:hypothetical protein
MNPGMLGDLADSHVREMRREAAQRRSQARPRVSRPALSVSGGRARLRRRIGFGLVEAGLHVLATTRPAP